MTYRAAFAYHTDAASRQDTGPRAASPLSQENAMGEQFQIAVQVAAIVYAQVRARRLYRNQRILVLSWNRRRY